MVGSAVPCPDQGTDYSISNLKMSVLSMDVDCGISILQIETYTKFICSNLPYVNSPSNSLIENSIVGW